MFKRNRLSLKDAERVIKQFEEIPIRKPKLRLQKALHLAQKNNIYAYDAYILDCANQYRSPILSLDKPLIKIAKELKLKVVEVET